MTGEALNSTLTDVVESTKEDIHKVNGSASNMNGKSEKNDVIVEESSSKEEEEKSEEELSEFLKNLCILPPLQKGKIDYNSKDVIKLPPIRAEEPVASLRAALSEVCGYSHLTNYRLVLERDYVPSESSSQSEKSGKENLSKSNNAGGKKKKKGKKQAQSSNTTSKQEIDLVSPYTGLDAVIEVPYIPDNSATSGDIDKAKVREESGEEIALDDYGDLAPLLEKGLQSSSAFRIILERYDTAGIRDHVSRLRILFDGNAPFVKSLIENGIDESGDESGKEESVSNDLSSGEVSQEKQVENSEGASNKEVDTKADTQSDEHQEKLREQARARHLKDIAENMPHFPIEKDIAVDGTNLLDYYYLSCGEQAEHSREEHASSEKKESFEVTDEEISRMDKLNQSTKVNCTIRFSGFNPPPAQRRLIGDLAYLEVTTPSQSEGVIHVTATALGFYINRTFPIAANGNNENNNPYKLDPAPASEHCFSHELLDCLLKRSKSLRSAWAKALKASKERSDYVSSVSSKDSPIQTLHRVAIRSSKSANPFATGSNGQNIDSIILRPSWLVPLKDHDNEDWSKHEYNVGRLDENMTSTHGLDARSGALRDWNEELQAAKEMPNTDLNSRIDRARLINKVLSDFGEAAVIGAMAIFDGHIAPMNPNEPSRSHVYLHNNIFFSRAVDAGVDTFKISQGDLAARKSASRDAQCMGALHRLDIPNLHTLATVLVDYLGTRLVCQSIVPGILHGERTHKLLYGTVEATSPLNWDEDMHNLLEGAIGKRLKVASRKIPTWPLTEGKMDEIQIAKENSTLIANDDISQNNKKKEEVDKNSVTLVCGPVEAKGIRGSDQRNYILDLSRLTPRDANWISESDGGTGNWEKTTSSSKKKKSQKCIPESVSDDEWTMAVLRPELIALLTHKEMSEYFSQKVNNREESADSNESSDDAKNANKILPEDEEYLQSLRYNLNVFLPNTRSLADIDSDAHKQHVNDEERVRSAAKYLWDNILPSFTQDIRNNSNSSSHQIPMDGMSLTESLHSRGINCRYLGRLAQLAQEEEAKDREGEAQGGVEKSDNKKYPRKTMPLCWLELLECEMVARAAKHVCDGYLSENGGALAMVPSQAIASFLSALLSSKEETAGETEIRLRGNDRANEDNTLTLSINSGCSPSFGRSRSEIWSDIEKEVGRRFRYSLSLYNKKSSMDRALLIPLLRRVCQRTGIRIAAKKYDLGGPCICSAVSFPGTLSETYPISQLDIIDIVPLVKHAAAEAGEGFTPCTAHVGGYTPSLHILLPDAKTAFDASQTHFAARLLPKALDLAQESASMYQRVVDTPLHPTVSRCLDLTAIILFQAQEPELAAANASRALAVAVQLGGFDCPEAVSSHTTLAHILISSGGLAGGVKHLRSTVYLMELMGGPHYAELANVYHKLGTIYHEVGNVVHALRFYQEATNREINDQLVGAIISKSCAALLASIGQYKTAIDSERTAYNIYKGIFGEKHEVTASSFDHIQQFTKLAVKENTRLLVEKKKQEQSAAADAIASTIEAEIKAEEEERKKKKNKKKSKKKS